MSLKQTLACINSPLHQIPLVTNAVPAVFFLIGDEGSGGAAGSFNPGGNGGHWGTCATKSRQAWRWAGDIFDQCSAFFKKS